MVSAFVGQGRPGRDEGPSQREPALGRRPSTGRPRALTGLQDDSEPPTPTTVSGYPTCHKPIGYRLDVDGVSSGVKAVAGLDRRCLQVFGVEYRVDEVIIASDEGRVGVDLGSGTPGAVRGPHEAR